MHRDVPHSHGRASLSTQPPAVSGKEKYALVTCPESLCSIAIVSDFIHTSTTATTTTRRDDGIRNTFENLGRRIFGVPGVRRTLASEKDRTAAVIELEKQLQSVRLDNYPEVVDALGGMRNLISLYMQVQDFPMLVPDSKTAPGSQIISSVDRSKKADSAKVFERLVFKLARNEDCSVSLSIFSRQVLDCAVKRMDAGISSSETYYGGLCSRRTRFGAPASHA